jgi:hypothetical protein
MLLVSRIRRASPHAGIVSLVPKSAKMPKKKCCSDKPACKRCPLRMMKEGTLPEGYTVKKRKLVKVDGKDKKSSSKSRSKIAA